MFDDNTKLIVVLTGSIGTGKSTIALYALCYIQYRLMILKEPWKFFGLGDSGKMTISFFNLNRTLGDSRGYSKMMDFMSKSPWFRRNALHITPTKRGEVLEFKLIKYVLASPNSAGFGIVGEDVIAGIMDEVDSPMDPEGQKERVGETYNATLKRFKSRFGLTGYSLGKLFVVKNGLVTKALGGMLTQKTVVGNLLTDSNADSILTVSNGRVNWATTIKPSSIVRSKTYNIAIPGKVKAGTTSGWVVANADNVSLVTLPASQTNSTLVVATNFPLAIGETITGFALNGEATSSGATVTLSCNLRSQTTGIGGMNDASVANLAANVSVTSGALISSTNASQTGLTEVIAANKTYYLLITGTTGSASTITLASFTVTVTTL